MKLLLSGATGFIGSHIIEKLIKEGIEVHAVVRPSTDIAKLNKKVQVFVFQGDAQSLVSYLEKERFGGVIHLASLFLVSHKSEDVSKLILSNVLFSTQLIEAASKAMTPWFINTGTFTQHYKNKKYAAINLYSATKQAFQDIGEYYGDNSKTTFVTIKLFDTFGPGDMRPKVFSLWSKISNSGEVLDMSPGEQIIDMNYVENVADGYIVMAKLLSSARNRRKFNNKEFTLSSGKRMTLKKLAKVFEDVSGKKLNIRWGGRPYRDKEVMEPWNKGKNVPGWKPKIDLKEAIRKTLRNS